MSTQHGEFLYIMNPILWESGKGVQKYYYSITFEAPKFFPNPLHSFFISTWPIKHMKAFFFEKIKHIAHEGFCREK